MVCGPKLLQLFLAAAREREGAAHMMCHSGNGERKISSLNALTYGIIEIKCKDDSK